MCGKLQLVNAIAFHLELRMTHEYINYTGVKYSYFELVFFVLLKLI